MPGSPISRRLDDRRSNTCRLLAAVLALLSSLSWGLSDFLGGFLQEFQMTVSTLVETLMLGASGAGSRQESSWLPSA